MDCVRCPFTLSCYARRLDAEGGAASLCVKCGQLIVLVEGTIYRFKCERRQLTPELLIPYRKKRAEAHKYPQRKYVGITLVDDPGPGLSDKLRLVYCAVCSENQATKRVLGTAVSLDDLEKAKEEGASHTFELAGSIVRKS